MTDASSFLIYRASAGSGKTFRLTYEYFKIIFHPQSERDEYKHILAVTFTNKATEEMKSRIINQLHQVAEHGTESDYGKLLMEDYGFTEDELRRRAKELRSRLLHDYGRIAVTTIDRFFQRIIKAFTKELGIFPSYNVELDQELVLDNAIQTMLMEVSQNKELCAWLNELIAGKIDDGKKWTIKGELKDIGGELFKEEYRQSTEKLTDKESLRTLRTHLKQFSDQFVKQLAEMAKQMLAIMEREQLTVSDFKKNVLNCVVGFAKEKIEETNVTKTTREAIDNEENWYAKKSPDIAWIKAVYPSLNGLLKSLVEEYDAHISTFLSVKYICRNLYLIGILRDLSEQIRIYCDTKGVMLLSDTTEILNRLIANNDTSFLFEKTGNYYHHLMIDEFQDTSTMQWANFKPLIVNSLSSGYFSLIVGDVKQSIYRWRNGDWSLLAQGVEKDLAKFIPQRNTLQDNWRSGKEIVEFNNVLFERLAASVTEQLACELSDESADSKQVVNAYGDVKQNAKSGKSGYVDIRFVEDEEKEKPCMVAEVTQIIDDYRARGGELRDVTVLVRNKKEGQLIADGLMQYNLTVGERQAIRFISNDSLLLWESPSVQFVTAFLQYMAEPFDLVNRAAMLHLYRASEEDAALYEDADIQLFDTFVQNLKSTSLFEIVESMIAGFGLNKKQADIPYLLAFQDIIFSYESENSNNVSLFLEWWAEKQGKMVLNTSEKVDALRILTIHKSKGLEFKCVILPFCNWDLDATRPLRRIWCKTDEEPFRNIGTLPIDYSGKLAFTCFKSAYQQEHLKAYVDSLNLLYVALTRACSELYIRPEKSEIGKDGLVKNVSQLVEKEVDGMDLWSDVADGCYRYGEKRSAMSVRKPAEDSLSLGEYPVYDLGDRVSVRYRYQDFGEGLSAVDEGKMLHAIFQNIGTVADVEMAVRTVYMQGLIPMEQVDAYIETVRGYVAQPEVAAWFSDAYSVVNERDILLHIKNGQVNKARPDRVMLQGKKALVVDYKFGKESSSYDKQVAYYCRILHEMGYDAQGYIWYVRSGNIQKVQGKKYEPTLF